MECDPLQVILREQNIAVFREEHKLEPDEPEIILDAQGETIATADDLYHVPHISKINWRSL